MVSVRVAGGEAVAEHLLDLRQEHLQKRICTQESHDDDSLPISAVVECQASVAFSYTPT